MSQATAIGEQLRSARERMGMSPTQAAERLHVDAAMIDALETGTFKALGAPVFVRGHLRRYAELLGEPDSALQTQYASLEESSVPPDLTLVPHLPAQPSRGMRARWPLIILAIALLVAAVVWWAMRVKVS
jgi:cytoskeleton protein RodZ